MGAGGQQFYIPASVLKTAVQKTLKWTLDRHGVAFLCTREHQTDLNGADDPNRAVAIVKIIEFCEKTSGCNFATNRIFIGL